MGTLFLFSHDGASTAFHKFFKNAMNLVETPSSGMGVLEKINNPREGVLLHVPVFQILISVSCEPVDNSKMVNPHRAV